MVHIAGLLSVCCACPADAGPHRYRWHIIGVWVTRAAWVAGSLVPPDLTTMRRGIMSCRPPSPHVAEIVIMFHQAFCDDIKSRPWSKAARSSKVTPWSKAARCAKAARGAIVYTNAQNRCPEALTANLGTLLRSPAPKDTATGPTIGSGLCRRAYADASKASGRALRS